MNATAQLALPRQAADDDDPSFDLDIPDVDVAILRAAASVLQGTWSVSVDTDRGEDGAAIAKIEPAAPYHDSFDFEVEKFTLKVSEKVGYRVWAFARPFLDSDDAEYLGTFTDVLKAFRVVAGHLRDPSALPPPWLEVAVFQDGKVARGIPVFARLNTPLPGRVGLHVSVCDSCGRSSALSTAGGWVGWAPTVGDKFDNHLGERRLPGGPLRPTAQEAIAAAWELARANRRNGAHNATA